ncbi:MAG: hypothetical protein QOJ21_3209 [Solirubrobacteraceae bacterium]|jgi:hypothetical protein|nr:hypothetical protein [Solirubrobacteraceae bacterium]
MDEILPGIHHWTAHHDEFGARVSSYYVEPAGALIDPMVPDDGLDVFVSLATPQQVVLTRARHFRHSDRFREAFGCVVRVAAPASDDLADRGVRPFWFGDEVAPGVTAIEIDVIGEDETALHIAHGPGAVAFGDALVRPVASPLAFLADDDLGAHPVRKKKGLKDAFGGLLLRDFEALLFAHGEPLLEDGKAALRRFVEEPVEYPEYGPYA